MDPARLQFLFGTDDPAFDVDDDDELSEFFAAELLDATDDEDDGDGDGPGPTALRPRALMRMIVARQILRDEPPEAWQTVERLRSLGFDRHDVLSQMALAVTNEVALALADEDDGAVRQAVRLGKGAVSDHYCAMLERLPVPASADVVTAAHDVVAAEQGIPFAGLRHEVSERLGRAGDELAQIIVDAMLDGGLERGALIALTDDRVIDPITLTHGIVLTHEYNESEVELEVLSCVGTDLGGFAWCDDLWSSDDDDDVVEVFSLDAGHVGWSGAEGWLDAFAAGDLLAVRVDDDRRVRIERLEARPAVDDQLVTRLRRVYESEIAETALPPLCTDLIFALLVDDPTTFDEPQLPFGELCERAGLEVRAGFVAHDDALWHASAHAAGASSPRSVRRRRSRPRPRSARRSRRRRRSRCDGRPTAESDGPYARRDRVLGRARRARRRRRRRSRRGGAGTSVRGAVGRRGPAADRAHDRALGCGHRGGTGR